MPEPLNLSKIEEKVLEFWEKEQIFKKLQSQSRNKKFVFYEGPPTANAGPGFHHVISRAFKDIIPRFKELNGFSVLRKAGWDTHGLPVELQIEKKIGIKTKPEIEAFGIAKFNRLCQESVWEFKQIWDKFTKRIGFWLDLENPYVTYESSYMESVWWILRKIWDRGLMEKDYKVVPYCARCGTPLSSHEVAQGYDDVKETSVYLKFNVKNPEMPNTFLLAWTTTPWTLPGNVALAINPEIDYVFVETLEKQVFILAKNRLGVLGFEPKILKEVKGSDLVGLEYEPLFDYLVKMKPENIENAFRVYAADFATDTDGTGIVHTAVMYGEDDFNLGKQVNLPFVHTVDAQGKFTEAVKPWKGVWVKDADPLVREELKKQGKLFKEEEITHTYPFCWRCHTPLLYYAYSSWFIRMNKIREELLANNEKIHWEPEHLKSGRFGEWLREVKDWALSRDRYWGTPLPVWVCEKDENHKYVVGSVADFSKMALAPNTYYLMRHGEAESNVGQFHCDFEFDQKNPAHLTEKGKLQAEASAKRLAEEGVEVVVSSDLTRTKETAEILKKFLPQAELVFDSRLREINAGILNGKKPVEFHEFYQGSDWFMKKPENGESHQEFLSRGFEVFRELEKKYQGKKIVVLTHNGLLWMMLGKLRRQDLDSADLKDFELASFQKFVSQNLPYNEKGDLDLHRPYVDDVSLKCQSCGGQMSRVKEVIDVWFDSGAMPLAQFHFPFAQMKSDEDPYILDYKKLIETSLPYPADYIAEAIDQTRGWFYTLLAISTLLDLGPAFLNVVSVGHVLDVKGEKMSKSKGNIVDPWQMIEKYGADSIRWYFYSVNSPGEYKKFTEKDLALASQELMTLVNVLKFFEFYCPANVFEPNLKPSNLLDRWILTRLSQVSVGVWGFLSQNKIFEASRLIKTFIDDLSRWYLRRSRQKFQKPESSESLTQDSAFLAGILMETAKVLAPFAPFLADYIWTEVNSKFSAKGGSRTGGQKYPESVHLSAWSEIKLGAEEMNSLTEEMQRVRQMAEVGLKLRTENGVGVRQALRAFYAVGAGLSDESMAILADELNVKRIELIKEMPSKNQLAIDQETKKYALDLEIDEALRQEGLLRQVLRLVMDLRKESGLKPGDKVKLYLELPESFNFLKDKKDELMKQVSAELIEFSRLPASFEKESEIDGQKVWAGI